MKARSRTGVPEAFVDALCAEIEDFKGPEDAASVFWGGGTPSLLSGVQLHRIMNALRSRFVFHSPEITVEANPDDVTEDGLKAWVDAGVNRVSLGVQSFDDRCLRKLGRRHDAERARIACELVARYFSRWNLDLIFGVPPIEAWGATLAEALALGPPHVATYGLTYEPGTPFERKAHEAVDEETSLRMYQEAEAALAAYEHYEVSNFALAGQESSHNLLYWHNKDYAGFGTGAYSYIQGVRARNHAGLDDYMRAPGAKEESLRLGDREIKVETLIQHFRLRAGLPRARYEARFGAAPEADFRGELDLLAKRGLLEEMDGSIRPTAEGFYLNNEIGLALVG
nr:putative radical SAM family protein [uncultured bacterium]